MTYHEKVWKINIEVITATIIIAVILAIVTHGNIYAVMASFGLLGFVALPSALYRRKLKEERDEMIRKIERKVTTNSIRVTWFLMFLSIFLIYHFAPSADDKILVPVWALWGIIWAIFILTLLMQSVYGLYYMKRGLGDED